MSLGWVWLPLCDGSHGGLGGYIEGYSQAGEHSRLRLPSVCAVYQRVINIFLRV